MYMGKYMNRSMHVSIYIYIHTYGFIVYIHINIYIYTHIYIDTQTHPSSEMSQVRRACYILAP